ncbi:SDR family NAD(P)-dependent oxidoreductase [Streptomyces sp. NPDC059474]|uniref:SDR family NAD(P)-dependent oxidoreductase n=1 Tax=Streptomyces sp. NPDC059474 TaxID=3346846 RepID=UPI0036904AFA
MTTPFGARSTAAEVIDGIDLSGRRAVVTGAASGIGIETARALAGAGAEVTLAVRNLEAGARVAEDITATTGNKRLRVAPLDLADRVSVAAFADVWDGPLDILVNNAGVMALPEGRTPEGWDRQFTVNHLGHFALARGLHGALTAAGAARIVSVSSAAHLRSPVVFDDLHFDYRPYEPMQAYGQSKTANVLFAVGAQARWAGDGITVNALSPGGIRTNLQRHVGNIAAPAMAWKTPEQGAATSVLLAASPLLAGVGGRYFADCAEAVPVSRRPEDLIAMMAGVAPYALDPEGADRLWTTSERLLASD